MDLDASRIKDKLVPGSFIRNVQVEREVDSTNARLLKSAGEGRQGPGDCLVAEAQTRGQGRRGRTWHSEPGEALTFSFLCRNYFPRQPGWITVGTAVAAARAIEKEAGLAPGIKWPNDLYAEGRKLGGILAQAAIDLVVTGVGLNVNAAPSLERPPVCLQELAGREIDRSSLLAALLNEIHFMVLDLEKERTLPLLEAFKKRSLLLGAHARFAWKKNVYEGRVEDHTPELGIALSTKQGTIVLPGETATLLSFQP